MTKFHEENDEVYEHAHTPLEVNIIGLTKWFLSKVDDQKSDVKHHLDLSSLSKNELFNKVYM